MRKSLVFGLCFLLVCSMIIPVSVGYNVRNAVERQPSYSENGNTLYVGGDGPGNYSRIQDAINDANNGDTVFVYDDSSPYYELLVINKSIDLIGEDRDTTVIDGNYKGTVVDIQADSVMVSGFTIIECKKQNNFQYNVIDIIRCENVIIKDNIISLGPEPEHNPFIAGVYIKSSSNNLIQDNIIFDDSDAPRTTGIHIEDNSKNNNISDNSIYGYLTGICFKSSNNNIIFGNSIFETYWGVDLWFADGNKILYNNIHNNKYKGIDIDGGSNHLISGNIIVNNGNGGEFDGGIIFSDDSSNNIITYNYISDNNIQGILLLGSDDNQITDNHISSNNILGIYADFAYRNTISRNNIIFHKYNAYFDSGYFFRYRNNWDGNYWGDYDGEGYYIIRGRVGFLIFFSFPWLNLDRNPASEPYDYDF